MLVRVRGPRRPLGLKTGKIVAQAVCLVAVGAVEVDEKSVLIGQDLVQPEDVRIVRFMIVVASLDQVGLPLATTPRLGLSITPASLAAIGSMRVEGIAFLGKGVRV